MTFVVGPTNINTKLPLVKLARINFLRENSKLKVSLSHLHFLGFSANRCSNEPEEVNKTVVIKEDIW